jgi:5-methylcytosine-specific restriction endonuclease McrA
MSQVMIGGGRIQSSHPKTSRFVGKGYAAHRQRYDQRRRLSERSHATLAFMEILAHDPCSFCGKPKLGVRKQDRDHIVPLLAGGFDTWENMTAACASCNRGRRDSSLLDYLARRNGCPLQR